MPFRSSVTPVALRLQRFFHTTVIHWVDNLDHYETLGVPQNASASDIKKSFYNLSKAHHPDHNPNDSNAASRFVKISEAYAILGHAEKRLRYDRDIIGIGHSLGHATPRGSYHSSGPVGGRPANGLSRRRTHFKGPPPSFYRSGGWGTQGSKRQAAQEEGSSTFYNAAERSQQEGGMGPGQRPFGHDSDVPHFDRDGHFRTHNNQEKRRQSRLSKGFMPTGAGSSIFADFFFVGGIISLGVLLPSWLFERMTRNKNIERDNSHQQYKNNSG